MPFACASICAAFANSVVGPATKGRCDLLYGLRVASSIRIESAHPTDSVDSVPIGSTDGWTT